MRAGQSIVAAACLVALGTGCVWEGVCVGGASRVDGRCVPQSDAGDVDADADASAPDAGESDGGSPDGSHDGGPPEAIASVAVGVMHICASTTYGRILCWGNNSVGQLGQGDTAVVDGAREVGLDGATVLRLSSNALHTCAGDSSARLWCWGGDGSNGEIGVPPTGAPFVSPTIVASTTASVDLAAGFANTCVATFAGVQCWGRNDKGQLGIGSVGDPQPSPGAAVQFLPDEGPSRPLEGVADIAVADRHICFRRTDGLVFCVGDNGESQLGLGTTVDADVARRVALTDVTSIASAYSHTCAVSMGRVYCWGTNAFGQSAPLTPGGTVPEPTEIPGIVGATQVVAGQAHTCALVGGSVRCWGSRARGQLGDGVPTTEPPPASPVTVTGLDDAIDIASSLGAAVCALRAGGALVCWGEDGIVQFGAPSGGSGMFLDGSTLHNEPFAIDPLR